MRVSAKKGKKLLILPLQEQFNLILRVIMSFYLSMRLLFCGGNGKGWAQSVLGEMKSIEGYFKDARNLETNE